MVSNDRATSDNAVRLAVAGRYSAIGRNPSAETAIPVGRLWAERLGYPADLLDTLPTAAVASFTGIANPVLVADLTPGEHVLDLGCGAGLDTIVMARRVAPHGHVRALDMASGMVAATRQAIADAGVDNVMVDEAHAEALPLQEGSIDVAIANGLLNLASDKAAIVDEIRRVLCPGGRLVGAEIVITDDRPPGKIDLEAWFR